MSHDELAAVLTLCLFSDLHNLLKSLLELTFYHEQFLTMGITSATIYL